MEDLIRENENIVFDGIFRSTKHIQSYVESTSGQYNLNGNAAELTSDGQVCGGSWNNTGYDVRNESYYTYSSSSSEIGFRPIIILKE